MLIRLPLLAAAALLLASTAQLSALGLSALPLAILLGILLGNLEHRSPSARDAAVLAFSQQKLLRLGIILFGFNLSFQQIVAIGWPVLLIDALVIAVVLSVGIVVGTRCFGLSREVAVLTSVGSAVCGAAAVMAVEPVVRARERDVTVAVATVVLFGTLAMFSYPLIFARLNIDAAVFGIYVGSTVHEVAQAVAAGQSIGEEAMRNAVVAKLIRVMLLAPVVMLLAAWMLRRVEVDSADRAPLPLPWFVLGFIAAAALNSLVALPPLVLDSLQWLSQGALALAMAALGYKTRWQTIRQAGLRPLGLALLLFVLLMGGGLALNLCFYG